MNKTLVSLVLLATVIPEPAFAQDPTLRSRSPHLLDAAADDADLRVTPVVKAVRRAADSVVSIYLIDRRRRQPEDGVRADGQGSGVILDKNGLVITNWHVVARATAQGTPLRVSVRLKNDRSYPARILSTSPEDDLALLDMDLPAGSTVKPIVLGDSDSLMIGETMIAIGNPQGHANTVTVGVLSAEDRSITVRAPDGVVRRYGGLLQTDAAINGGNSGGALLDITGKLVGINNAMGVGLENIGFAIPVNSMKRAFQDRLLASEYLANVWIGMAVEDGDSGVRVNRVDPFGPASRAGIREGDRLLRANGTRVESSLGYARSVLDVTAGAPLRLDLQRGDRRYSARPVPLSRAGWELSRRVGIEVASVAADEDRDLVRRASLAFYSGERRVPLLRSVVRVQNVYPDGPADRLGIEPGDVLLGYRYSDGWFGSRDLPFRSEQDLVDKVRAFAGGKMLVFVLRGDKEMEGTLDIRG